MKQLHFLHTVAVLLTIIGAVNWGIYAYSPDMELIRLLLGGYPLIQKVAYYVVAASGLLLAYCWVIACGGYCKQCKS